MSDVFDLKRFIDAQDPIWPQVEAELRRGRKTSHWMWFVFPQLAGLGASETSRRFALADIEEAKAFLAHPILGPRLRGLVDILLGLPARSALDVFGPVDAAKLRSCLTLFAAASPDDERFVLALDRHFGGERDPATLSRL